MVSYGRGPIPNGTLPIFSVDTEEEAQALIVLTCPTNLHGEYIAPELVRDQTLENLYAFGDRLRAGYALMKSKRKKNRRKR